MTTQTEQTVKSPRRRRRRFWLVLLLLLGGGWVIFYLLNPPLRPVTRRLLPVDTAFRFSANGLGYPVVESGAISHWVMSATWLDARCQPAPGLEVNFPTCHVSPSGTVAVAHDYSDTGINSIATVWRTGQRDKCRVKLPFYGSNELAATDRGFLCNSDGDVIKPDGTHIKIAGQYGYYGIRFACADPRYLTLFTAAAKLMIFDITLPTPALVTMLSNPAQKGGWPVMVFSRGQRFLVVPACGTAVVCEAGKVIGSFGNANSRWQWGEDGTAWGRPSAGKTCFLRWHTGIPTLAPLPLTVPSEDRFLEFALIGEIYPYITRQPYSLACAAWGDGRLIAVTSTQRRLSEHAASTLGSLMQHVKIDKTLPREARTLTLYRNGNKVGTYGVWMKPEASPAPVSIIYRSGPSMTGRRSRAAAVLYSGPGYSALPPGSMPPIHDLRYASLPTVFTRFSLKNYEHLAFSKDGRYLSWIVNVGRGPQVYVFETGKK